MRSSAALGSDGWVTCDQQTYAYQQAKPLFDVPLYLTAGGSYVIDKTTGG